MKQLTERGYLAERLLPDGREVGLMALTIGRARICLDLDRDGYGTAY